MLKIWTNQAILGKNPKNLDKKDQIPAKENETIKKNDVFECILVEVLNFWFHFQELLLCVMQHLSKVMDPFSLMFFAREMNPV